MGYVSCYAKNDHGLLPRVYPQKLRGLMEIHSRRTHKTDYWITNRCIPPVVTAEKRMK